MKVPPAIGIDLGTTFSCVAVLDKETGRVEVIPNDQGNRTMPSVVGFTEKEKLVGETAVEQAGVNPDNTVFDVKRIIGRKTESSFTSKARQWWCSFKATVQNAGRYVISVIYQGKTKAFEPEEISAMILSKLKKSAETYLGEDVTEAVITVPAYFNNDQKAATLKAGEIAGLKVLRLLAEPTAAAVAYGLDVKSERKRNVLVFDLGGGTLDVSVLEIQNEKFEVKSTSGDTELGGRNFDNCLLEYCVKEFKSKHKHDLSDSRRAIHRLRTECDRVKRSLTSALETHIHLENLHKGIDYHETITRARFDELTKDLIVRSVSPMKKALEDAKLSKDEINDVVMVGGASRIPAVCRSVEEFFDGKKASKRINPDEAIARGAALFAARLKGDKNITLDLTDVTPLSLRTGVHGGGTSVLIERNTPIPCTKSDIFCTTDDNQTEVLIDIYEGERELQKDNLMLDKFRLSGIPPLPAGEADIEVTFAIDVNGILVVTARDKQTGGQESITVDRGNFAPEEIAHLVLEFEKFKIEDQKQKDRILAMNALQSYAYNKRSEIEKEAIPDNLIKEKLEKVNKTLDWIKAHPTAEKAEIESKHSQLKQQH